METRDRFSLLKGFIQLTLFRMETVISILYSIRVDDFIASSDPRDIYFRMQIHGSVKFPALFRSRVVEYYSISRA